ncbi:MAG: vWA domain-containing protein [Acidimicrobiales bacterium]
MGRRAPDLTDVFVEFGRSLRSRGLIVGSGQLARFCSAVACLDPEDLADLYWAGRSCLVTSADDVAAYDAEFAWFFLGIDATADADRGEQLDSGPTESGGDARAEQEADRARDGEGAAGDDEQPSGEVGAVASLGEVLRYRSFADWTAAELAVLPTLLTAVEVRLPLRRARRLRPADEGTRLDLRRTVHRSLRHEGELLERAWRHRRPRPRKVVMLVDVSGSMSAHARALLHFAYAMTSSALSVEVFCFGTRLTRVTDLLADRDPNRAVARASTAVVDWAGGTRIGESLGLFLRRWGSRGAVRGAVVLLFSDGLERGSPETLGIQMGRLARLAFVVVWLNPLKGDPTYQPLARGMQVALPHVDRLVAADTFDDLCQLARMIPKLV